MNIRGQKFKLLDLVELVFFIGFIVVAISQTHRIAQLNKTVHEQLIVIDGLCLIAHPEPWAGKGGTITFRDDDHQVIETITVKELCARYWAKLDKLTP
ncbi:MAG: hypothetical protein F6K00_19480 [Leptolyngbya sp. SIOISBB]|nr:hypothetical protein [Leptolyngbya sp. SIOISBB]